MRQTVMLPRLGDTTEQVLVVEWVVEVGDVITAGDTLITAETDKVDVDVPAPLGGTLIERLVEEGDEIPVGTPIALLES